MSTYQRQWRSFGSIIRQRGSAFQVETSHNGRRKRETFDTEDAAVSHAKKLAGQIKQEGDTALAITGPQRLAALELLTAFPTKEAQTDAITAADLLGTRGRGVNLESPLPTPIAEAVRFWLVHHPEGQALPTLTDALAGYLDAKKARRAATVYEIQHKVGRFVAAFEGRTVADVTAAAISDWLTDTLDTLPTQRKYLNLLRTFFGHVCKVHNLAKNPAAGVALDAGELDQTEVEAYTVEEVRRILIVATGSPAASQLVPTIAVGLFAGLRPAEVQGLDWADVSLAARRVRVSPETAKRRRSRYVDISDNLADWLAPYAKEAGPVSLPLMTYRRARAEVMEQAKCRFIRDGFRHSFGTYHLAAFEDAAKTALALGHRGNTDLVFTNYRKLVTREEGRAYWTIRPPRLIEAQPEGPTAAPAVLAE